jgi:hypothetical protein
MLKISTKKIQRTQFCEEEKKKRKKKGMFSNIQKYSFFQHGKFQI